jgi:iron complex outermembrane receptor protein
MARKIAYIKGFAGIALLSCAMPFAAHAQVQAAADPEFDEILALDIADLSVTSVSRREQKLTDTAAAVYVITQEDLRRSGATSIPEALRLAPGVQVAKVGSNRWAISARGFNGPLSNKLLVLLDGRTIYTPVFSGTYWDDQGTLIEDIDRIEVIRGPGASLWGANAVNGVINIITKKAEDTQGNLVSLTGSLRGGLAEGRHGGKIGANTYYRSYLTHSDVGSTVAPTGGSNKDSWDRTRAGFRVDTKASEGTDYTFQGDIYGGEQDQITNRFTTVAPFRTNVQSNNTSVGGNVLGRWTHQDADGSQFMLQGYLDHYIRLEDTFDQRVSTSDIQLQQTTPVNGRNNFIWGGGARVYAQNLAGEDTVFVNDRYQLQKVFNIYAQNEYAVIPRSVFLTVGSKLEHNDFTGFEIEPSTRLSWQPTTNQTLWGAISRAVRTPSTYENDVNALALVQAGTPLVESRLLGNPGQKAETVIAYELGYRIQPKRNLSFNTSLFYNTYDRLQTISSPGALQTGLNGNTVVPYSFSNLGSAHTYGAEIAANWNISADWRLAGSYTFTRLDVDNASAVAVSLKPTERQTPRNQFAIQSYYSVSETVHWDNNLYYVGRLSSTVPSYLRYDTRMAWLALPGLELSLIGRNLLDNAHPEFPGTPQAEVRRTVIGQVLWKF